MQRYEVYLHFELLEILPKRGTQRRKILDFIRSLGEHPSTTGESSDKDDSLRTRQIKIVGNYAITSWVDHPVKAVMIVDIPSADK